MRKLMTRINVLATTVVLSLGLCLATVYHTYTRVFWIAFQ